MSDTDAVKKLRDVAYIYMYVLRFTKHCKYNIEVRLIALLGYRFVPNSLRYVCVKIHRNIVSFDNFWCNFCTINRY